MLRALLPLAAATSLADLRPGTFHILQPPPEDGRDSLKLFMRAPGLSESSKLQPKLEGLTLRAGRSHLRPRQPLRVLGEDAGGWGQREGDRVGVLRRRQDG